jgi:hypothetical protein
MNIKFRMFIIRISASVRQPFPTINVFNYSPKIFISNIAIDCGKIPYI